MPLLEVKNVGKSFGPTVVLSDINFTLEEGQILGLCGENGAGKSTLMNILFGMNVIAETGGYTGEVIFNGERINFASPNDALEAGIGMVHQEFSLIPGFSAAENIRLNREITKPNVASRIFRSHKIETLDMEAIRASAEESVQKLNIDLPVTSVVQDLPVGYKQFIEIAREINKENVKLLILDEPTAVLTESEASILLDAMKSLAESGIAIIFISHRLREVIQVCDKILVMRDGLVIAEKETAAVTVNQIAGWMIGREVGEQTSSQTKSNRDFSQVENILEVEHLYVDMPGEFVEDTSFTVHKGEIFGIAGLAGQGKLGIPNGIMGLYPSQGKLVFKGQELPLNNPRMAQERGLAFVSEDRKGVGLLIDEPISWNICFNALQIHNTAVKKVLGISFRNDKAMDTIAQKYIQDLDIKTTGPDQKVGQLSGGNQQKVCLAKAFCLEPELLLVSEPTRGIDVGAKEKVLEALRQRNKEFGTTIIIVSSELEELRSIADRIAVVDEGRIIDTLPATAPSTHFGLLMSGEKIEEKAE